MPIDPERVDYIALSSAVEADDADRVLQVLMAGTPLIWARITRVVARFSRWDRPLLMAVGKGKRRAAQALLEAGWDANDGSKDPNESSRTTPLHHAVISDDLDAVRLLLDHRVWPVPDALGVDPVQWARELGKHEIADLIVLHLGTGYQERPPPVRPALDSAGGRRVRPSYWA